MPPRPPGTREELKERVLAKYGATNITDDDLAALMALEPELDMRDQATEAQDQGEPR